MYPMNQSLVQWEEVEQLMSLELAQCQVILMSQQKFLVSHLSRLMLTPIISQLR